MRNFSLKMFLRIIRLLRIIIRRHSIVRIKSSLFRKEIRVWVIPLNYIKITTALNMIRIKSMYYKIL